MLVENHTRVCPPPTEAELAFPRSAQGCTEEIKTFIRGGSAGLNRLKQVLPSLFNYFGVYTLDSKAGILTDCGLTPLRQNNDVTFSLKDTGIREPMNSPLPRSDSSQGPDESIPRLTREGSHLLQRLPSLSSSPPSPLSPYGREE